MGVSRLLTAMLSTIMFLDSIMHACDMNCQVPRRVHFLPIVIMQGTKYNTVAPSCGTTNDPTSLTPTHFRL